MKSADGWKCVCTSAASISNLRFFTLPTHSSSMFASSLEYAECIRVPEQGPCGVACLHHASQSVLCLSFTTGGAICGRLRAVFQGGLHWGASALHPLRKVHRIWVMTSDRGPEVMKRGNSVSLTLLCISLSVTGQWYH